MVGHTRKEIYFANLLTIFLANAFVYLAGCFVTGVMGTAMFGWNLANPMQLAFRMFSGILMLGAYAGVFTLISMLIDNRAISATVCMVLYVVMFIGTPFLQTAVFSYYHGASLNHMPSESIRPLLEFLYDFLPVGQELQISGIFIHLCRLPVYSVICIALTTACGIFIFTKKDLK